MRVRQSLPNEIDFDMYRSLLSKMCEANQLTNNLYLVQRLEAMIGTSVRASNVALVSNGTSALELALKTIKSGEIITTPFSFKATSNAILNAGHSIRYVDVKLEDGNIDEQRIESAVNQNTVAILAVHVYGNPCELKTLQRIASKYRLKLIFDSSHSFGSEYLGESILTFGDITCTSLHATKVFSTVEGGLIISKCRSDHAKIVNLRAFGDLKEDNHFTSSGNYKLSELHAAWGISQWDSYNRNLKTRQLNFEKIFDNLPLSNCRTLLNTSIQNFKSNYSYCPTFNTE